MSAQSSPRRRSPGREPRIALGCALALIALTILGLAQDGTLASFVARAANGGNQSATGTVALGDNDSGSALFSLSGQQPNAASSSANTRCVKVTSNGSLASTVRLYASTGGSGLAAYTGVTITRGSYSPSEPAFGSCTNFVPDASSHAGQGPGVIYGGALDDLPAAWSDGLVDPAPGSPETWTTGESHVYKLQLTVADNRAAEGKNATPTFTFEARNQ